MTGNPFTRNRKQCLSALLALTILSFSGCATRPGKLEARKGDEIVVAGQLFHTGTPVILWMDPGGYDAYRVERRFSPFEKSSWAESQAEDSNLHSPNRYDIRGGLTEEERERVRGGGWDLPLLQKHVDQFVLHYDEAGTSHACFKTLQDSRGLSVHFMLDLDGTIYQTLDLKERAWHATTSNSRSVGIEIANVGGYEKDDRPPFKQWFHPTTNGPTLITIPKNYGTERTPNFQGHPARPEPIVGVVQEKSLKQYDFTPEQYQALIHLTATLCTVFPKIKCDYPRDETGQLINHKLPDAILKDYAGVLGHFHVQTNKVDPGPAFQWDYVINHARWLMQGYTPVGKN